MIRDISKFEPCIEFIRGRDNFMADALSRLGWNTQLPEDDNPSVVAAMESKKPEEHSPLNELDIDQEEFRAKQEDPILKPYLSVHRNEVGLAILEGQGQSAGPCSFRPDYVIIGTRCSSTSRPQKIVSKTRTPLLMA